MGSINGGLAGRPTLGGGAEVVLAANKKVNYLPVFFLTFAHRSYARASRDFQIGLMDPDKISRWTIGDNVLHGPNRTDRRVSDLYLRGIVSTPMICAC